MVAMVSPRCLPRVLPVGMPGACVPVVAVGVGMVGLAGELHGGGPAVGAVVAAARPHRRCRVDIDGGGTVQAVALQADLDGRVQAAGQLAGEGGERLDQLADGHLAGGLDRGWWWLARGRSPGVLPVGMLVERM